MHAINLILYCNKYEFICKHANISIVRNNYEIMFL